MRPLVVVGDALLDVDVDGVSDRLCPDAPVPVVDLVREWRRPGGAGLAALLAARSTAEVVLIAPMGDDQAGHALAGLLEREVGLVRMPLRGTTVTKTRVRAAGQSLVRLDSGDGEAETAPLTGEVRDTLRSAGAILVADYGRGITGHPELRRLLGGLAGEIPVVWDPHPRGAVPVGGIRLATPNLAEAEQCTGTRADAGELAELMRAAWDAGAVSVTTGSQGAVLTEGGHLTVFRPPPGIVAKDTCGAGDRFASAATAALLAGATTAEAVAAGVDTAARFVATGGAATLSTVDSAPVRDSLPAGTSAFDVAARTRARGGRLVATGGCFDLLHPGHASLLRQARALGDALVVCLNSDESVRGLKGPGRPIVAARDRARLLTELGSVDAVAVFDEPDPAALLDRLRPDVWVKGGDYADTELPESAVVHRHGGEIVLIPTIRGYSTSRLVAAAEGA
ncbi:D-beta-D-heptose 1-phosphate adenosyltransferase [Amycolatopsis thailandensis]|uniref:D-beta-D-heptose 1-phosphate adenosyltransferase n=1 Tax=Amycolatopsis thailandensis TaxID=589330 RepID=A0A229SEA5_9PSEU|nr:PfkB family carbohydrate kinase [Amycolatopsis thailandensis]OXM57236.1 D-beta-D-heptose 1-phosphate adenosyltransferase [Amycolatopsis thailandensis]